MADVIPFPRPDVRTALTNALPTGEHEPCGCPVVAARPEHAHLVIELFPSATWTRHDPLCDFVLDIEGR